MGAYPNTYTFTKALSERMLMKNRGNLPVVIVRPSIIQGNYDDPFMGWTDTIAASGFQMMMVALGLLHFTHTKKDTVLDLIPCDFVSNQIIVQTVYTAVREGTNLNVVHVCTSDKNPLNMLRMKAVVFDYLRHNPYYAKPIGNKVWW